MTRLGLLLFGLAATIWPLAAQQPAAPKFDVVSIKRSPPDAPPGRAGLMPGGRYVLSNGPIRVLIGIAYPTQTNQMLNAPDWVTNENYDVTALAGPNATFPQVVEMIKAMLAERLRLEVHYETRNQPAYELVVASPDGELGPRLQKSSLDCDAIETAARARNEVPQPPPPTGPVPPCRIRSGDGVVEANSWPMENFAENLRRAAGRVVLNRTGLAGGYDFRLEWAPDVASATDSRPTLFAAIQEQLGLRLQPTLTPLPVLVIDSVERPTPD